MKSELLQIFESARKAADAAKEDEAEETRCVDALKELKKVPVTMEVLVETQVGKRLRILTKHPREKIQALASDVLDLWKKIVLEETSKKKNNGSSETGTTTKVIGSNGETVKIEKVQKADSAMVERVFRTETIKLERSDRIEITKSEKVSRSETVKVEKIGKEESIKVEKVPKQEKDPSIRKFQAPKGPPKLTSMIKCNDSIRDKTRELLADAFVKVSDEADEYISDEVNACDPIRLAVSVESALFDKLGRSNGTQKHKYRSIIFNIRDPKNPDFRRRILLGEVKPETLTTMSPEDMASDQRRQENNQIREKTLFDCERGGPEKATTDQFRCGRCGQRKTTYYQLQTRSADEPMTTFVTCVNCNNHWKFC